MSIITILFLIYLLIGMKWKLKGNYDDYLSPEYTKQLKGTLAIVVVFSHIAPLTEGEILFAPFSYMGYLAVAGFFFFSGFGLMKQYTNRKEAYLNKYLLLRLPTILIPYFFAILIYFFVLKAIGEGVSVYDTFLSLINGEPLVQYSWYVIAIFVFYIFFYISCRLGKNNKIIILLNLFLIGIYIVVCFLLSFETSWYYTSLTFVVGISWAVYSEKILLFIDKYYYQLIMTCVVGFGITTIIYLYAEKLLNHGSRFSLYFFAFIIFKQLSAILFVIILVSIGRKTKFSNPISNFLGSVSFEIYLYHGLAITLAKDYFKIDNKLLFATFILVASILTATLLHQFFNFIIKKYTALIKI